MILKEILQKHFSDNICVFYKFILIIVEVFSGINFYIRSPLQFCIDQHRKYRYRHEKLKHVSQIA